MYCYGRCCFPNYFSAPADCTTGRPKSQHSYKCTRVHTCILFGSNVYGKVWWPDYLHNGVKHRFTTSHIWTSCAWLDRSLSYLLISRKLRVQIAHKRLYTEAERKAAYKVHWVIVQLVTLLKWLKHLDFKRFFYFDLTQRDLVELTAYMYTDEVIQPNKQTEDKG